MADVDDYIAAALRQEQITTANLTCSAAPVQLQGKLTDGRWWYFRARGDQVQFGVGSTLDDAVEDTITGNGADAVDGSASWLDPDEVRYYLDHLVPLRLATTPSDTPPYGWTSDVFDPFPPDLPDALRSLAAVARHCAVLAGYVVRPYCAGTDRRVWRWRARGCWRTTAEGRALVARLTDTLRNTAGQR